MSEALQLIVDVLNKLYISDDDFAADLLEHFTVSSEPTNKPFSQQNGQLYFYGQPVK